MDITVEKILEFRDIFPNDKDFDVREVLCGYNRDDIVRIINCLGMNYGNAYLPDPENPFFSDISQNRIDELNPLLDNYFKKHNIKKIPYITQRSILELMRITFSIPIQDFQDKGVYKEIEYDLFRIILFVNQQLMKFQSANDITDLHVLTFLIGYVSNDVTSVNWKQSMQTQTYYIDRLSDFLENNTQGVELKHSFLENVGISSFNQYIQTILGLIVLYIHEQKQNRRGCPILRLATLQDDERFIHKSVCDFISLDINAVIPYDSKERQNRDNNTDYREFRSHPLIRISDGEYFIYNLPLLCERLYNSMFFDLKQFWNSGDYFQFYNKEIVEHQIFQHTMLKCIGKKTAYFYPNREDTVSLETKHELPNQPDFYIREQDALILFECKGIKIDGSLKDKSDADELMRIIKNKLYLSSENIDPRRKKKEKCELVGVT